MDDLQENVRSISSQVESLQEIIGGCQSSEVEAEAEANGETAQTSLTSKIEKVDSKVDEISKTLQEWKEESTRGNTVDGTVRDFIDKATGPEDSGGARNP